MNMAVIKAENASDSRALDRLNYLATQAEGVGNIIDAFLDRCSGNGSTADDKLREVPSGHLAQLERLSDALIRAERLAYALNDIG
jgi:hypothetical protein